LAFQVASFAGYLAVFSSDAYDKTPQVLYFAGAMYFGHGRGRFGSRDVKFYKRNV